MTFKRKETCCEKEYSGTQQSKQNLPKKQRYRPRPKAFFTLSIAVIIRGNDITMRSQLAPDALESDAGSTEPDRPIS